MRGTGNGRFAWSGGRRHRDKHPLGRAAAAAALCLFATVASPGCNDPELLAELKALGEGCLLDSDCEEDLVCVFRKCHYQCVETKDCLGKPAAPPGVRCVTGDKPSHVCLLDGEVTCGLDVGGDLVLDSSACPGSLVCGPDGECRDACSTSAECVPGQVCVQGTCADADELNGSGLLTDPTQSDEGTPCTYNSDCAQPLVCKAGLCREACKEDVDCPEGQSCAVEPTSGKHVCKKPLGAGVPDHCGDGATDGDETGVDCGGTCFPCPPGEPCADASDCQSGVCTSATCLAPDCSDGVKNGLETGADCGGPSCAACAVGVTCATQTDCQGGLTCDAGTCVGPDCLDGTQNGDETGVDCGGSCAPCDPGAPCVVAGDCSSLVCSGFVCAQPSCNDGLANGAETGKDCGGGPATGCAACPVGGACNAGSDCSTGVCGPQAKCLAPTCADGVMNGLETGIDCGGACAQGCGAGVDCQDDGDCALGLACKPGTSTCEPTVLLTVSKVGSGTVTEVGGAIDCGLACAGFHFAGDNVTLHAEPGPASTFAGWSDPGCPGAGDCSLTLNADTALTATFTSPITAWARSYAYSQSRRAAFSSDGTLFTGGPIGYGQVDVGGTILVGADGNVWLAAYAPGGGDALWGRTFYGDQGVGLEIRALEVGPSGDLHAVLRADGDVHVNALTFPCPANVNGSIAVVRLDAQTGAVLGGACHGNDLELNDAAFDANGDLLVAGVAWPGSDAGGGPLFGAGATSAFLARYDAQGAFLAQAVLGGGGMRKAYALAASAAGTLVVGGACVGATTFGALPPFVTANGQWDACAVALDLAWTPTWQLVRGSPGSGLAEEQVGAAAFTPAGDVVLAGAFMGLVDFTDDGVDNPTDGGASRTPFWVRASAASGLVASPADVHVLDHSSGDAWVSQVGADAAGRVHLLGGGSYSGPMAGGAVCPGIFAQDTLWLATWDAGGLAGSSCDGSGTPFQLAVGPSGQLGIAATANQAAWLGLPGSQGNHVAQLLP